MSTMRAVDDVLGVQRDNRTCRSTLLANTGMRGSVDQSLPGEFEDGLLESSDEV